MHISSLQNFFFENILPNFDSQYVITTDHNNNAVSVRCLSVTNRNAARAGRHADTCLTYVLNRCEVPHERQRGL